MPATRAHTVPRFYLRGFVAPKSENVIDIEPYVWLATVGTNDLRRAAPKNVSIERGFYDGPGGFDAPDASIERHLATIESDAARAITEFTASHIAKKTTLAPAIWRFLAWQAARTPGWFELIEDWIYDYSPNDSREVVEPPPDGFEKIRDRARSICMEDPDSGERCEVACADVDSYRKRGWKWIIRSEDRLEMLHVQAWYFQVRHFPRLKWSRLNAPDPDWFVTSDRGVTWIVDGYIDTPPAALRDPSAVVVAPLTRKVALVGRHGEHPLNVTPRQVNQFVAASASKWVAGPSWQTVHQAIQDRGCGAQPPGR
jgi:hypothetical protein